MISRIIYDEIKCGKVPDIEAFCRVADDLFSRGCERILLGCTELSLLKKNHLSDPRFIDSTEVLALSAIRACGKAPIGFDDDLMHFLP